MPESRAQVASLLAKVPIFADLDEKELKFITDRAVSHRFAAGELIFSEGDPCNGLYVVQSGRVRIFKTSPSGREQVLGVELAGNSVAELPVFDGGKYPASASAIEDSLLLFISRKDFQSLCLEHPEVALKVLRVIGLRLRRLVNIIEELSFTTVRHRLAAVLLRMARHEARGTDRNVSFTLNVTNQELAAQIGTVRELVSRNLSRLQADGIIHMEGKTITVPELAALEAELQEEQ